MINLNTLIASSVKQNHPVMRAMRSRVGEFQSALSMNLTAVSMIPEARQSIDDELERRFQRGTMDIRTDYEEIIIGGGPHAAIYAAVRVLTGHPRPLIVERNRIGGVFACSRTPSFYLNSRNRAGEGGLPSENAALNYLPGFPLQLSQVSSLEFQTNADMAWVTRLAIALYADVLPVEYKYCRDNFIRTFDDKDIYWAKRVVDARGLGNPLVTQGPSIFTFTDFMAKMDTVFPMRGMKNVAVYGNGDSAKCVVEALLGAGPALYSHIPALDNIEQVDLYGRGLPDNCEAWRDRIRGRYQAIGSYLKPLDNGKRPLRVFDTRAAITPGYQQTKVNGRSYDTVISASGWNTPANELISVIDSGVKTDSRYYSDDTSKVLIGPAARIPFDQFEENNGLVSRDENSVALFRLAPRTAAAAARLS